MSVLDIKANPVNTKPIIPLGKLVSQGNVQLQSPPRSPVSIVDHTTQTATDGGVSATTRSGDVYHDDTIGGQIQGNSELQSPPQATTSPESNTDHTQQVLTDSDVSATTRSGSLYYGDTIGGQIQGAIVGGRKEKHTLTFYPPNSKESSWPIASVKEEDNGKTQLQSPPQATSSPESNTDRTQQALTDRDISATTRGVDVFYGDTIRAQIQGAIVGGRNGEHCLTFNPPKESSCPPESAKEEDDEISKLDGELLKLEAQIESAMIELGWDQKTRLMERVKAAKRIRGDLWGQLS